MGKAHRGRRLGESETAIQREAVPDFLPPGHQANPTRQGRRNIECKRRSSLFDQTPPHENIRGSSQGVGNETWANHGSHLPWRPVTVASVAHQETKTLFLD